MGLRGFMLKPSLQKWVSAPTMVWFWLLVLSIACAHNVLSILGGAHALGREAAFYTALAVSSMVMLVNLYQQQASTDVLKQVIDHLDEAARLALQAAVDKIRGARS